MSDFDNGARVGKPWTSQIERVVWRVFVKLSRMKWRRGSKEMSWGGERKELDLPQFIPTHQPWNSLDSAARPKDLRKSQRQVMMPGIEPGTTGASPEVNTNYTTEKANIEKGTSQVETKKLMEDIDRNPN
eukprot:scaffold127490_cov46-Attheya_sp.AAC.2